MNNAFSSTHRLSVLPPLDTTKKSVAILLATYNGASFLSQQLNSIEQQTHTNWRVYASDDGSSDGTLALLTTYCERWGQDRLRIYQGPQRGHAANFMSLVHDKHIQADYYAFCDQDDVWLDDKLERSIASIKALGETSPVLYGSRTTLIDFRGRVLGQSPLFDRMPSLKNALVQSLVGGNTILFNNKTRHLICLIPVHLDIITHDWATYLIVMACDGEVYYDEKPTLLYRQHGENLIGSNNRLIDRFVRLKWLFKGRFKCYSESNLEILSYLSEVVPKVNASVIQQFKRMREAPLLERISLFKKSGLYRQTRMGTLGLWVAILIKKI